MGHRSEVIRGSLWIRPNGPALEALRHAVRRVQDLCGGPGAIPHITLLGGIENTLLDSQRHLKQLAAQVKPFKLKLGKLKWYDEYYRCFFVRVEPSPALLRAQALAHAAFEMNPPDPDFEPHISLLYGDVDGANKQRLAKELGDGLDGLAFTASSVQLTNAAAGVPVHDWRTLAEVAFNYREIAESPKPPAGSRVLTAPKRASSVRNMPKVRSR